MAKTTKSFLALLRGGNLGVPLVILCILAMVILPLPPALLDILFTFNIVLAVMVLLVAVSAKRPLEFSLFPTILLITTLMRLTLNVASTRVVLLHGHLGAGAAGKVIESFGQVVIGGNFVVGFVVFIILMIINFIGYGRWEAEFAGNKAESDTAQQKTRLAFAGLKYKDLGSFDYGRNLGALYDVEAWTDMFPEFGGDSSAQTDNFMTKRASGLATYRNTDFFGVIDGLNLTLQYQGKNENRDVKKQNGDGFGTSLTYDFGGSDFAISGAYTNSDRTNEQNLQSRGTGKRAEAWATGLKYDANNIYLATFYSETRKMTPITGGFANKTQNFEAVAQYQFDFGLRPSLGYVLSKGKDIEGIGDEDLVNYIDVGATYYFNKNMSAFVDYKINQLDSDNKLNINNDDIVAVGMTYQF
ncbi:phosphoporin PhoE [Escherichia coli]